MNYREILDEYLDGLEKTEERIERYTARIKEFSQKEPYKEKVGELCCLKGLATISSMTLYVETSDFNRFTNAKSFASYCGFENIINDSGDKHKTCMSINKQGSSGGADKRNIKQKKKEIESKTDGAGYKGHSICE